MARKSEVYGGDWIKATKGGLIDIPGLGLEMEKVVLTIRGEIVTKKFDDGQEQRVISFAETEMKLGLNGTNWDAIAEISGKDDDLHWQGVRIELFAIPQPKSPTGHAIRVRKPRNQPPSGYQPSSPIDFDSPPVPPARELLGEAGSQRLAEAIVKRGLTIDEMRKRMNRRVAEPLVVASSMAYWPREWAAVIKECLDAPADPPDSDIPF